MKELTPWGYLFVYDDDVLYLNRRIWCIFMLVHEAVNIMTHLVFGHAVCMLVGFVA